MQALGPGVAILGILGGVPMAAWALRSAPDRGFALAAACVAALDLLLVLAVVALALA